MQHPGKPLTQGWVDSENGLEPCLDRGKAEQRLVDVEGDQRRLVHHHVMLSVNTRGFSSLPPLQKLPIGCR